jgi:hypothetical protein
MADKIAKSFHLRLPADDLRRFAEICAAEHLTANQGVATLIRAVVSGDVQMYAPRAEGRTFRLLRGPSSRPSARETIE